MNRALQKEYRLVYFKYAPEDILIKVYPLNSTNTEEENTDYIISKIDNNSINLFLVKKAPNERDYINYKYRVVFYKPQKFNESVVNIPVYSFQIYFKDDDAIVKYEPFKAVPKEIKENNLEKKFEKHPTTNIYFIKDYNGEDFLLSERMRKVKFIGKIKNANGTYTPVKPESNLKIKLIKIDEEISEDNTSDIKKDYIVEVPLYQDVTLGLVAYRIERISEYTRYDIKSILINNVESDTKIIHFAEIWNNMYEQELVFQDDGSVIDFNFDPGLYDLEYIIDNKLIKQKDSPLSLSLKQYDNKDIKINLTAKDFVVRYLKHPTETIEYKSLSYKRASDVIKEINQKYSDFTEITEDGALKIKPNFNQISFAIFSNPTRAKIKYKRLEPSSENSNYKQVELGETPIFFEKFDYGKYIITATWYEKEDNKIKEYFVEKTIEFSEPPSTKFLEGVNYLRKGETEIPYLMFYLLGNDKKIKNVTDVTSDSKEKEIIRDVSSDDKLKENKDLYSENKKDVTSDSKEKEIIRDVSSDDKLKENKDLYSENKKDVTSDSKEKEIIKDISSDDKLKENNKNKTITTDKTNGINDKEKKEDIKLTKKAKEDLKYIKKSNNDLFYIQIAAFQIGEKPLSFINYYGEVFANEYKKMYNKDIKNSLFLANKVVNKKNYIVIVFGSFKKIEDARKEISLVHDIVNDAFIVKEKLLESKK